jgi:hypothetical protein
MTWLAERAQPWSWTGYAKTELNRLRMRLAGYNGRLLSVVVPRRLETPSPVVKSIECLMPGIALRVEWPWASDTVIFQPLSRFLQTESCTGSGRLAVVREKDGVPTRHLLVDGYELNFKGQVLVPPLGDAYCFHLCTSQDISRESRVKFCIFHITTSEVFTRICPRGKLGTKFCGAKFLLSHEFWKNKGSIQNS